jgi:hypothetical protein
MFQHLPLQDPPKFTPIEIFGLKIWHLATLVHLPGSGILAQWNESDGVRKTVEKKFVNLCRVS